MDLSAEDGQLRLATERLTYRPFGPEDLPALTALVSDWRVVRQLGSWPWPPEPALIAARCGPYQDGPGFVWAILADGALIGSIGITGGNLGYKLHHDAWGRGYASEAARFALDHAFADPALSEVTADTWVDNTGSQRVLAKLGFVRKAILISHAKARGTPIPRYRYVLPRAAWQRLR